MVQLCSRWWSCFLTFCHHLSSYPLSLHCICLLISRTPTPPFNPNPNSCPRCLSLSLSLLGCPVLTLLWSSTYPPFWLSGVATGAFWPPSAILIRQRSFGYRTGAEFRPGFARLWRGVSPPSTNPLLACCWLGWTMWTPHFGGQWVRWKLPSKKLKIITV